MTAETRITRTKVESSNIKSIGHDPKTLTLEVEFKNKKVYQYNPISEEGFKTFMNAESKGEFFAKNIRDNKIITYKQV